MIYTFIPYTQHHKEVELLAAGNLGHSPLFLLVAQIVLSLAFHLNHVPSIREVQDIISRHA